MKLKSFLFCSALIAQLVAAPSDPLLAEDLTVKSLPNGTLWIHRPVRHNSIMAFHLFFPTGAANEPAQKAGVTTLMADVMFKGTKSLSALQLAQAVESIGASLDADADTDYWNISGQSTSDKFEPLLAIFREVLLSPSFPESEFEKEKSALLNAIQSKKEQIFDVAHDLLEKTLFGDHPYGRPEEGTIETVSRLTREDVAEWHRKCSLPKGTVLVTAGNLPVKKLEALISKTLGGWESNETPPSPPGTVRYPDRALTVQEQHPFEQSYLMLAYPAPTIGGPDYAAVKTLNALLGGGMSSPLFRIVREEGSLAYEVSAFFPTRRWGSAMVIYAGTDPKDLGTAEEKIRKLLTDMLSEPATEEDLANAKRYIRGNYLMDHQTNSRVAWYLGWWQIMGLGYDYDRRYPEDIEGVSIATMNRAADTLLRQTPTTTKIISTRSKG